MTSTSTILLFGMPRSGTTWTGKILDSHPDTVYRHEPDVEIAINDLPWAPRIEDARRFRDVAIEKVARIRTARMGQAAGTLPAFPKSYLGRVGYEAYRAGITVNKFGKRVWSNFPVLFRPNPAPPERYPLVWKSIESLPRLPILVRNLDNRRAIVVVRHPCGHVASVLRGEEGAKFKFADASSEDYGIFEFLLATPVARDYGLTMEQLRAATPVQRLAWRWVLTNEVAIRGIEGQAGCAVVKYEDVCFDPVGGAKRLLELAGLSWNAQTEDFVRKSTSSERSAYYSVIKNPQRSAMKWKEHLTPQRIAEVESVVANSRLAEFL